MCVNDDDDDDKEEESLKNIVFPFEYLLDLLYFSAFFVISIHVVLSSRHVIKEKIDIKEFRSSSS